MKHLSIVYDGKTFFDGEVGKFQWTESANGTVEVKVDPPRVGFLEKMAAANAQKRQVELTVSNGVVADDSECNDDVRIVT